jgi:hypothetical protein
MNKIEEFLQNLDTKNKIMLYLSILVLGIIIYYNYNLNVLNVAISENNKEIKQLQRKSNISLKDYNLKLTALKKEYKKLLVLVNQKMQDLDYLNKRLALSSVNINDKKFYSLMENILNKSYSLNLMPNFYIDKSFDKFKEYSIDINGSFGVCNEKKLFDFIKFLESRSYVNNISNFQFDKNSSNYFIRYNIWGI